MVLVEVNYHGLDSLKNFVKLSVDRVLILCVASYCVVLIAITFVKTWFFASTTFLSVHSSAIACFITPLDLVSKSWFRVHAGTNFHALVITGFIDMCSQVIVYFAMLLMVVTQNKLRFILQNKTRDTILGIIHLICLHPVSNSIVKGFERPVFMIDVCQYKNSTCCLIQTTY